jgi:hypothetical protein
MSIDFPVESLTVTVAFPTANALIDKLVPLKLADAIRASVELIEYAGTPPPTV